MREKGNYEQWVKFFLQGIYESAEDSIETINALTALHDKNIAAVSAVDTRTGILKKLFTHSVRLGFWALRPEIDGQYQRDISVI